MIALSAACGGGSSDAPGAQWVGHTYELTIHSGLAGDTNDWLEPTPDLGSKISGPVVPQFLLGVTADPGGALAVTLGTAKADVQDPCTPTVQARFSEQSYPDATIGPIDFPMHLSDPRSGLSVEATIHDVTFANILPGSAAAARGTFDATIDIADVYSLVTLVPDPTKESVCGTLSDFMVPCQTCAFDGQPYCLPVEAVGLEASESPIAVMTIAGSDVPTSCQSQ